MTAIPSNFGSGGANLVPGGAQGQPSLADTLRDIADDLAALNGSVGAVATIASPDITAVSAANPTAISAASPTAITASDPTAISAADAATQSGSYVQADVQTIATLANDLKLRQAENLTELVSLKARGAEYKAAIDDLIARQAENRTELTALKLAAGEVKTLLEEIKDALNAVVAGSTTILTTKA